MWIYIRQNAAIQKSQVISHDIDILQHAVLLSVYTLTHNTIYRIQEVE